MVIVVVCGCGGVVVYVVVCVIVVICGVVVCVVVVVYVIVCVIVVIVVICGVVVCVVVVVYVVVVVVVDGIYGSAGLLALKVKGSKSTRRPRFCVIIFLHRLAISSFAFCTFESKCSSVEFKGRNKNY